MFNCLPLVRFHFLGVKLLLDFVPNHTSDEHPWFQMSNDPSHPLHQHYKDFYVWLDAKGTKPDGTPIPPTNWVRGIVAIILTVKF